MYKHRKKRRPEDTILWRYMDITKFISMLETRSIHFTQLNRIAAKEDIYEGYCTNADLKNLTNEIIAHNKETKKEQIDYNAVLNDVNEFIKHFRLNVGISSWYINKHESSAMWKIYSKDSGLAIKTNVKKLTESLHKLQPNRIIKSYKIKYLDYNNKPIMNLPELYNLIGEYRHYLNNKMVIPHEFSQKIAEYFEPFSFCKRHSFRTECEFRLLTYLNVPESNYMYDTFGDNLGIVLDDVIEEVRPSPYTENWVKDLIRKLMIRYNINTEKLIIGE